MNRFSILMISLSLCCGAMAQKAKKAKTATKAVVVVEDPRLEEMRQSIQKIIFIDSVVVDKKDILSVLNQTKDVGTITTLAKFFNTEDDGDSYVFLNEMGNKCFYSKKDEDSSTHYKELYVSDLIGNQWTNTQMVTGLANDDDEGALTNKNYPFMMSDGTTLYFAAQGEESIGGWDIFVTRYDVEDNTFFRAENIGMPFNSPANDYFYIVDDINNIGWFATDRNQPEGKVCVYAFIPSVARRNYDADAMDEEQLKSFASLHSIKDTWGKGNERDEALRRLNEAKNKITTVKGDFVFVVNDNVTYTTFSQFKNKRNAEKMKSLLTANDKLERLNNAIETSRSNYAKASAAQKDVRSNEIRDMEQQIEELEQLISKQEKEIRNSENQ